MTRTSPSRTRYRHGFLFPVQVLSENRKVTRAFKLVSSSYDGFNLKLNFWQHGHCQPVYSKVRYVPQVVRSQPVTSALNAVP